MPNFSTYPYNGLYMNEELINDLKQFISATVSQATAELGQQVDARFDEVNTRLDDLDSKVTAIADAQAETLEEHEQRISRLETGTA